MSSSNRGTDQEIADLKRQVKELQRITNPATVTTGQLAQGTALARGAYAGFGNPQNDTVAWEDNVDATHGLRLDYIVPSNYQRLIRAKLTIVLRAYRTYNDFAVGGGTGAGTSHSHGHTHGSHNHKMFSNGGTAGFSSTTGSDNNGAVVTFTNTTGWSELDSFATTPTSDATTEAAHTHPIASASNLGVIEGATANNVAILFDGDNQNAALGGPFTTNQVELDITAVLSTAGKTYLSQKTLHTITLTPSGLGRIHGILRLTYFADGSVAA